MQSKGGLSHQDMFKKGSSDSPLSRLTAKLKTLPTLPAVVNRVMELTADPNSSATDLMKVIQADVALTTTILKTANSALYSFPRGVSSLQQAITLLGFLEVRNIVMAKAVFSSFKSLEKEKTVDVKTFWEHSLVCAMASRIISKHLKIEDNEAFVAGLIHDIGKLAIYLAIPEKYSRMIQDSGLVTFGDHISEKRIFDVSHDEVGMMVLKRWRFPASLVEAVGFHHRIPEAGKKSELTLIVHVADLLSYLHLESPITPETIDNSTPVEQYLYKEILTTAELYDLDWDEKLLGQFRSQLSQSMETEAETLKVLFS